MGIASYIKYAIYSVIIAYCFEWFMPGYSSQLGSLFVFTADDRSGPAALFCIVFVAMCMVGIVRSGKLSPHGKAVLITGCDSGFGLNAALHLDKIGMHVFAACHRDIRTAEGARKLQSEGSERMKVLQLEVTSDEDVQKALEFVTKNLPSGAKGLWGLINNAGKSTFGEVEFCPMETYEKIIDINLHGSIRVTKAFLPLIRRARGRVLFVTSVFGRLCYPICSAYSMSKFALESFATTLRYEQERWGVKVCIMEPGNYIAATNIFNDQYIDGIVKNLWETATPQVKEDYGEKEMNRTFKAVKEFIRLSSNNASLVISDFEKALLDKNPRYTYESMDLFWKTLMFLGRHAPSISEAILVQKLPAIDMFK